MKGYEVIEYTLSQVKNFFFRIEICSWNTHFDEFLHSCVVWELREASTLVAAFNYRRTLCIKIETIFNS
jgi:hypothetical protein